jgi:hypothetical protein
MPVTVGGHVLAWHICILGCFVCKTCTIMLPSAQTNLDMIMLHGGDAAPTPADPPCNHSAYLQSMQVAQSEAIFHILLETWPSAVAWLMTCTHAH